LRDRQGPANLPSGKCRLLAPNSDSAVNEGSLAAWTPALYCSCGVVRAPDNDPDIDRKSEDDDVTPRDDVTPPGGDVGDSGAGTGLVMQNTIRLKNIVTV